MKRKSLLFLLLFALLAPWAANAQTSLFSEDFESGSMPTGWTTSGDLTWTIGVGDYSTSTGAGHGEYNAKMSTSNGDETTGMLITPEIDLSSVTTAELSFMYVMRKWVSDIDELHIYYRTSSSGTWTQIAEYTNEAADWTTVEGLALPNPSSTYQIAFEAVDLYGYGVGIDYINIVQGAATPKPSNLAVSNVTDNSATLSWQENGTATSWQICLNDDETNLIPAPTNPFTLTGLTAQTAYTAKVRSVGTPNSDWTNPLSFTTTAVAVAVGNAWSDDFEGTTCGWDLINGTQTNQWAWGSAINNGGTNALYVSNDNGATNAYTITTTTTVYATKLLAFEASKYIIEYDWKSTGESTWDYVKAALAPASAQLTAGTLYSGLSYSGLPQGWIAVGTYHSLSEGEWETESALANITTAGNYYLVLLWRNDSSGGTNPPAAIDNVSITKMACPYDVEDLAVSNVTTNSATLSWTAGDATQWQVEFANNAAFQNSTQEIVSTASYPMTGLQSASVYYARVRAYCGGTDYGAWCTAISFPTACDVITTYPYTQNFDGITLTSNYSPSVQTLPMCWSSINKSTDAGYSIYPTVYYYSYTNYANSTPNSLRFYSYYSGSNDPQDQYAILPEMQNLNNLRIKLYARAYSTSYDATFHVGIMTDPSDETTFTEVASFTPTTTTYELYTIPFNTYTGNGAYIAIMMEAAEATGTSTTGYRSVFIDDITVEELPSCLEPSGLTVQLVPGDGTQAILSWTENGTATSWEICLNGDETNTIPAPTNPFTLTGLTPETVYTAKVRANCASPSAWSEEVTFQPTEKLVIGTAAATSTYLPTYAYYKYSLTEQIYTAAELGNTAAAILSIDFNNTTANAATRSLNIYLVNTTKSSFEGTDWIGVTDADLVYSGAVTFAANGWTTINLDTPFNFDGTSNVALIVDDNTGTYVSSYPNFSVFTATSQAIRIYSDGTNYEVAAPTYTGTVMDQKNHVRLLLTDPITCFKPINLTAGAPGARRVELSWTEKGTATAWQICLDGDETNPIAAPTNPYTLSGLTPATTYTVKVRSVCGEGEYGEWSDEITFTTDVACPAPVVEVTPTPVSANVAWTGEASSYNLRYALPDPTQPATIILTAGDVWGDGSGYQMLLDADHTAYGTIFGATNGIPADGVAGSGNWGDVAASVYEQFEYKIPVNADGALATTNMIINNSIAIQIPAGVYDWCITNPTPGASGRMWIAGDNGGAPTRADDYEFLGGMTYEFTMHSYTVDDNTGDGAELTLSYNGNGPWIEDLTNVSSPVTLPVNADPLTPETTYIAQVQAVCGGEDGSSLWATEIFTTPSNCDAPNTLTSSVMPTSATLSWTGYQDDFNIQYRTAATRNVLFTESFESGQTTISSTWTEITSGDATGVYEGLPHDGDLMYGFMATDDPQYLITPELEGVEEGTAFEFYHVAYYCDVTIKIGYSSTTNDVSSFTWGDAINISSTGADYVLYSVEGVPAGTKYIGIQVVSMGDYYYFIDDFTAYTEVAAGDWMPAAANVTSPYVLEGLAPETEYEWQVQGNNRSCEDGVTAWSESGSFTTADYCDEPEDLLASDITANAATLSWTGYQNSFNVQYRESEVFDDLSFYEFFNAQGNWTTDNLETSNYEGMASGWDLISGAFAFVYTENPPQTIISPELTIAYPNSTLMFNYLAFGGETYPETFKVGFSTTTNDLASFEWGDEITATNDEYLERYTTSVPDNAKYLAIQCTSDDKYVLAIDNLIIYAYYEAPGDWVNVEVDGSTEVTSPVTIEGLDPNTMYDWQVRGVNCDGEGSFTEWVDDYFTTEELTNVTQTMELSAGKTWFSTYVNITLDNLKDALVAALPGATSITITSQSNGPTRWNGRQWRGQLSTLEVNQMYIIEVPTDCEITLEGEPIDPASCPIDIATGSTWIGFPLSQNMAVSDAFSALPPTRNDIVTSQGDGSTKYMGSSWRGQLTNLEPGKGYIYKSAATDTKTLTYPATSKVSNNDKASNMPSLNKKTSNLPKLQKKGSVGSSRNNSVTAKRFVRTDCKSMPYKRK